MLTSLCFVGFFSLCVQMCLGDLTTTNEERREVLRLHNLKRTSQLSSNMQLMQWDFALEEAANSIVSTCQVSKIGVASDIGQNSYILSTKAGTPGEPTMTEVLTEWFDNEKALFDKNNLSNNTAAARYIQISWASSNRVGCSKRLCAPLTGGDFGTKAYYFTCLYAARAALALPFLEGKNCSSCPATHKFCVSGMCSPGEEDGGDFGAMVFPEGDEKEGDEDDDSNSNSTDDKKDGDSDGDGDGDGDGGFEDGKKRAEPKGENDDDDDDDDDEVDIGGKCPNDRNNIHMKVVGGVFSGTADIKVAVAATLSTQVYYTDAVFVKALEEIQFTTTFQLFTCMLRDAEHVLTLWVFDCSNQTACGGAYGIPEGLNPTFHTTVPNWWKFDQEVDVEIRGGVTDPRKIVLQFDYDEPATSSTGTIIAVVFVILIIAGLLGAGFYWYKNKNKGRNVPHY